MSSTVDVPCGQERIFGVYPKCCLCCHQCAVCRLRLHSRPRSTARHEKTSEQEELERVQLEKQAAAALKRRNAEAVKHVRQPPAPAVAHSNRPLTEPQPLELCTSKRRRMHGMETRSMVR